MAGEFAPLENWKDGMDTDCAVEIKAEPVTCSVWVNCKTQQGDVKKSRILEQS